METKEVILKGLNSFYGTEHYYRHWVPPFVYTDGVKYLAEKTEGYWLLDAICSYQRNEPYQIWELKVNQDKSAVLTMKEDDGKPILVEQKINFTTFPLEKAEIWLIDGVLLLPSEY